MKVYLLGFRCSCPSSQDRCSRFRFLGMEGETAIGVVVGISAIEGMSPSFDDSVLRIDSE